MSLEDRVFGILMNANTLRINFLFDGINGNKVIVHSAFFVTVAAQIKAGKISIVEGTADPDTAIYTARNDGNLIANTFYFGQSDYSSKSFEALVVHESVHAAFDMLRTTIPWIDNEVAAYIAQGFYANNAGVPDKKVHAGDYIYLGKMISNDIIANKPIDDFWMDSLRDKLRNDPTYSSYINTNFVGNG